MASGRTAVFGVVALAVVAGVVTPAAGASATPDGTGGCGPGAHTLSTYGQHVYPETGNGGYTSVHTDVDLMYDAVTTGSCRVTTSFSPIARRSA